MERSLASDGPYGSSDLILSGFARLVTHPRIFREPAPLAQALDFAQALRAQPNAGAVRPGARHWEIFQRLCTAATVKGNLVADAFLAARAIESGSE